MDAKKAKTHSKFLSLVLRHKPETIGINLDENGWVDVDVLLLALKKKGRRLEREELEEIVRTNNKKRFAFSEDGRKIRASQGHSVQVDLQLEPIEPPKKLFHGTASKNVDSIFKNGIEKRGRTHVHLSGDRDTAVQVGRRHGKSIILEIMSKDMQRDGIVFYRSDNGVFLVDYVDPRYIRFPSQI